MKTIYRDNADRLSVADAKRLILKTLPPETSAEVYARVDENGEIDFEGPVDVKEVHGVQIYANYIDRDFLPTCEQLNIQPRMKYRPVFTDYNGDVSRDTMYTIAHDEFVGIAELFGLLVVKGEAPEQADTQPQAAPVVQAPASEPPPVTTGDIAYAFDGLRKWNEKAWKDTLGSPPKWLQACIVIRGQRGVRETRWSPVLIGAALVSSGHAKPNSIRAKFQTVHQLKPWLDAWKTYEADYLDSM